MTIVVCVDEVYWRKSQILFESLKKNWYGRVCVLCVDFKVTGLEVGGLHRELEFAFCKRTDLKSCRDPWPGNRHNYFCSESGEFLDYFEFEPDELIIHLDADMIMQRPLSLVEREILEHIEQDEIAMSPSAFPVSTLREELFRLNPRKGYQSINEDFPGVLGEMPLYCCGMVVARAATYLKMHNNYLANIDRMIGCFNHHAASQWIFNYITYHSFNLIKLSNVWHNASWFIDSGAKELDNQITTFGVVTIFNHTKFEKEYKY